MSQALERFSISISAATIIGVLAKLAFLYNEDKQKGNDWFTGPIDQKILTTLLLAIFLIIFRGKIMHDDVNFFADLGTQGVFKSDNTAKILIKLGLFCAYVSWLLWAPAIYFLADHDRVFYFLTASLAFSTIWLVLDIVTREKVDWKRALWIVVNMGLVVALDALRSPSFASVAAILLLTFSVFDWLISDPFAGLYKKP